MIKIAIFGDSFVYGRIDPENGGWVSRLKSYFEKLEKFNGVFNLGIPGNTSKTLLKRIKNECEVRRTDIIIIEVGTNDASYVNNKQKVSPEEFELNLQKIIDIVNSFSSKIVFVGIPLVDETKSMPLKTIEEPTFFENSKLEEYNEIIKKACIKNKIFFIDLVSKLEKDYFKYLSEGVHFNSKGHQKIFEIVEDFLNKNKII
jgi:lysophospholipase L1-like esterase